MAGVLAASLQFWLSLHQKLLGVLILKLIDKSVPRVHAPLCAVRTITNDEMAIWQENGTCWPEVRQAASITS